MDNTAINGNDIYCTYTLVLMENQTVKADANTPINLTAKLIKENNLTEDFPRVTFLLNNTDVGSSIVDSKKFTANYEYKNYFDDILIVSGKFYNFNIANIKTGVVIFENSTYRNRGPYYVSIDGDDYKNDGSENSPFRTLAHAVSFTNIPFNNKTIIVKKGVYNEDKQIDVRYGVNIIGEDNPTITSNLSTYLFMAYEDMRINGISFVNHYSEGDAGVILSTKSVYLNNSNFINCTSEGYGGAIYAYKDIYAENTSFINNTAYVGGSINGLNINVNNCTFINSSTKLSGYDNEESQGGAIEGGDIKVNNCTFIDNSAEYIGGAINSKFTYSIVNVTNSIFIGNHVKYGSGGAISSETEDNYVNNCTFINNSGDYGGAIGLPKGTITNSTFKNNSARTGGAISLNKGTVENCSFMNNSAREGYVVEILSDGKIINFTISPDQYSLFNYHSLMQNIQQKLMMVIIVYV